MTTKPSLESDWARAPPPSGPAWRQIAHALYNPEEKSFLGRTPKRWGIVLVFYSVFYAVLALMFAACMGGLFMTLDYRTPTYTLEKSLIGNNPGVAARPRPTDGGAVVRYDSDNSTGVDAYVKQLNEFFGSVQLAKMIPSEECTAQDNFGYPDTPCMFIKLNKIIGWKPDCYNDAVNLPADMPEDLKDYIKTLDSSKLNQIWVSCWEEKSNTTSIEYPWGRGLSANHYPYTNEDGYRSPVVAIKLTAPVNTAVVVRCRVWAKNVVYKKSLKEPSGYTRIQLYIEDGETTEAPAADN
ncbi:sodium/potassium-transporting ATPase subunit beta-1-like isoform X2 [Ostrinia furnacalis]|uniref:sodium/potassium-transporting ATPase subunit beta-1-like isoform X2 n=1 Tax=Ostrinia furnacalis TaxID=93504 RepID=UPI00103D1ADC|nr:sodium/potassium-transporting ATPase subunit beta-1-like isoform X2 [Ostrinia furnacalis]